MRQDRNIISSKTAKDERYTAKTASVISVARQKLRPNELTSAPNVLSHLVQMSTHLSCTGFGVLGSASHGTRFLRNKAFLIGPIDLHRSPACIPQATYELSCIRIWYAQGNRRQHGLRYAPLLITQVFGLQPPVQVHVPHRLQPPVQVNVPHRLQLYSHIDLSEEYWTHITQRESHFKSRKYNARIS